MISSKNWYEGAPTGTWSVNPQTSTSDNRGFTKQKGGCINSTTSWDPVSNWHPYQSTSLWIRLVYYFLLFLCHSLNLKVACKCERYILATSIGLRAQFHAKDEVGTTFKLLERAKGHSLCPRQPPSWSWPWSPPPPCPGWRRPVG